MNRDEEMLLKAFAAGELVSEVAEAKKANLLRAAEACLKKDKRINIRLAGRDLEALQRIALREGMPYQTLIASILHKFVSGQLEDLATKDEKPKPEVWRIRATRYPD